MSTVMVKFYTFFFFFFFSFSISGDSMSYFPKRLYVYQFGMYLASNQSGLWNDLTCSEVQRGGHCVFVLAKFQFCNRLSIFSLCLWRLIIHLLELGFASLKGNLTQTRRAIASVTIHSKGSTWDQFFLHTGRGFPQFSPVLTNLILHTLIRPIGVDKKRITARIVNTLVV